MVTKISEPTKKHNTAVCPILKQEEKGVDEINTPKLRLKNQADAVESK